MPGISFICDLKGGLHRDQTAIRAAMDSVIHDERYERHEWLNDEFQYLAHTGYREYPIEAFETADAMIYFEGRLYGGDREETEARLDVLAGLVFKAGDRWKERTVDWLLNADGDFVLLMREKRTGEIVILNDIFGRLPLYCYRTGKRFILSRELRFIVGLLDHRRFDRMALAQHLLVGYPLGERTLLEDVERVPAATCIRINAGRSGLQVDHLYQFNCEAKTDDQRNPKDNARELARLFSQSCTARAGPNGASVISLSGGFDSRAIAACFHKNEIAFRAATFLDPGGRAASDVPVARTIANMFGAEWKFVSLNPPQPKDVLKLLRMKNGMNPLYMSFLLAFLDQIKRSWGSDVVFISGEIGDKLLPDRRPSARFEGPEKLVARLISNDPKFPLEIVAALTGLKATEIIDEWQHYVSAYPEEDWVEKYVHFVTWERAFKWLYEGEDRNRCYFWNVTPYSGIEFFNFAMRCPDEQKFSYGLYREFLLELSPAAAAVEQAGTGTAITSNRFTTVRKALEFLQEHPEVRRRIEPMFEPSHVYDHDRVTLRYLGQQAASDAIFEYLAPDPLRQVVDGYKSYTKEAIDLLFTLTATIEELLTGKSVLDGCA